LANLVDLCKLRLTRLLCLLIFFRSSGGEALSKLHSSGAAVSLASLALLTLGCSSGPSRIEIPSIDADDAADRAMTQYDTDGDGLLNSAELEKSPGLNAAKETLDTNGDDLVSEEEIVARIESWLESRAGLFAVSCSVTLDKRSLSGTTVTFEPEPFLGDGIKTAIGKTSSFGLTSPSVPKENRPSPDMPPGIQPGLYLVKVSKIVNGSETIPAKYNTETILGQQISNDDPAIMRHSIVLDLKTK